MTPSKPPKSLREMADDTAKSEGRAGIRCRKCGCADVRVWYTRPGDGVVKRMRMCRNCGEKFPTHEKECGT